MKKNLFRLILIFLTLLFNLSFNAKLSTNTFNSDETLNNIKILSSDKFAGRLAGTLENDEAAQYLKSYLISQKIAPFNGSYYDSFSSNVPHQTEGKPYLKVTGLLGETIKDYTYGSDFKEDMLNFKTNEISFNKKSEIAIKDTMLQVGKNSSYYLFYVPQSNDLSFRSSFIDTSAHDMYIMVTEKTLKELENYLSDGDSISCFIPIQSKNEKLNNVTGFIQGKTPSLPPIILSAHFDHVGRDLEGNIYSGALDNASGVSFVMEMIKYIKSIGTPERSVIFAFFNGEELGCQGSSYFAEEYKNYLMKAKVLNFDMIGSNNDIPLSIMGGEKDSKTTPFIKEISLTCSNEKVNYNYLFQDASDHESFRKLGIDAVTFCDDDLTRIHTPNDKADFINTKAIDRCYKVASKEVISLAYENNPLLAYNNDILWGSLISLILIGFSFKILVLIEK